MKRTVFLITILICLSSSLSFGIAPVGQPTSNLLQKGWWSLGVDYSMSTLDLDVENASANSLFSEGTVDGLDINLLFGKASLAVKDNWEVFVGIGTSKTGSYSDERTQPWGNSIYTERDVFDFDSGSGTAFQIGTKYTYYEKALLKAGITCQLTWLNISGTLAESLYQEDPAGTSQYMATYEADIDSKLMMFQVAPGISYDVAYGYSLYGGPVFQWISGESTIEFTNASTDMDINSDLSFGAFVGLHAEIDIFTSVNVEYQKTGSSSTIGVNLTTKF